MKRPARSAQELARRRVVDYVGRLGLRRAARRLSTDVKTIESWLSKGFPKEVLPDALAFSGSGGLYVSVRKTRTKELVKQIGKRRASKLLGIPAEDLKKRIKRNAPVRFSRPALVALVKKRGLERVAKILGTSERSVDVARKPVPTAATGRLRSLVEEHGEAKTARFLGISESRLRKWSEWNVPRTWERAVSQKIGRDKWARPKKEDVEGAKRRTKREIDKAKTAARGWNSRVPPRFRIGTAEAERQARLGQWDQYLALAKHALAQSKKAPGKTRGKAPPLPPVRRPKPVIPRPEPKPRKRPKEREKTLAPELASNKAIRNFQELRAEAFVSGEAAIAHRYRDAPFGRMIKAGVPGAEGFIEYGKVENFAHLTDLDALARRIVTRARALWKRIKNGVGIMTVRLTFSAAGSGNPFYPDAWVPDENKISFFRASTLRIDEPRQISEEVYGLANQIYEIGTSMLLFIEHFEIARSAAD